MGADNSPNMVRYRTVHAALVMGALPARAPCSSSVDGPTTFHLTGVLGGSLGSAVNISQQRIDQRMPKMLSTRHFSSIKERRPVAGSPRRVPRGQEGSCRYVDC